MMQINHAYGLLMVTNLNDPYDKILGVLLAPGKPESLDWLWRLWPVHSEGYCTIWGARLLYIRQRTAYLDVDKVALE